jgi:hypothetical protein
MLRLLGVASAESGSASDDVAREHDRFLVSANEVATLTPARRAAKHRGR